MVDKAEPLSTLQAQRRPGPTWGGKQPQPFPPAFNRNRGVTKYHQRERLLARYPAHLLADLDPVAFEPSLIDLQRIAGRFA